MKSLTIPALLFICLLPLPAQDVITMRTGDEIDAEVTEISDAFISYHKVSNPDGPVYKVRKAEIFMIKYKNGQKDVFPVSSNGAEKSTASGDDHASDLCRLVIFRDGQFYASALNYWIFVNGEKTCKLSNGKYLEIEAPAGLLEISARRSGAEFAKKTEFLPIIAEAGQTYYIEGSIVRSLTRRRMELSEVTENTGIRDLRTLSEDRCTGKE